MRNSLKDLIIRALEGLKASGSLEDIGRDVLVIAHDLTPSDTATMDKRHIKEFATEVGGKTSHTAIMARSFGIPAVLGLKDITWNSGRENMYSKAIVVENKTGLHARPASTFVSTALKFKSNISITKDSKKVNAKSIILILSLGVSIGSKITITAEGPDEEAAVSVLCDLINSRFGEE